MKYSAKGCTKNKVIMVTILTELKKYQELEIQMLLLSSLMQQWFKPCPHLKNNNKTEPHQITGKQV